MKKLVGFIALAIVAAALFSLSSCAHSQELVSITVQPGTETVGAADVPVPQDAGFQVQLQAVGTYIHPPVTKDITNQVTWASNDTGMFTVNSSGMLTATGLQCGGSLVSATLVTNSSAGGVSSSGAAVIGYMNADVVCYTGSGSGIGPAVTVTFGSTSGSGTVSSSPSGLGCTSPNPCVDEFPVGTELTLTATPTSPSTSATWGGTCPVSTSTSSCTFTLETNTTVTATFN
jgi:hypothetical protein